MSSFKTIKTDKKGNIEKAAIMDVVFFYVKCQEAVPIFDQKDMAKPTHFEYTIEVVCDEDTADAYDETSPKQTAKKMTKEQIAKKYKLVDENGKPDDEKFVEANLDPQQKKFYVIKKAQAKQTKDGSKSLDHLRPKVFEVVDGKSVEITYDKLVGNGSKGSLMLRYTSNPTYGSFSYPAILKIDELIEYEKSGGNGIDSESQEFLGGDVEFAEAPTETSSGGSASGDEQPPFEPDEQPDFGDDELY